MILTIDVGNTNIVIGVFDGDELKYSGRLSTALNETDEEYAMRFQSFFKLHKVENIEGAIISSVVPAIVRTLKRAIRLVTGVSTLVVGPGVKTGLNIKLDNPAETGADLVVGAVAATNKYPCPQIIFDFGTATTATIIDKDKACLGGTIFCGVGTALNAISTGTAQLPQIDLATPSKVIGTNTIDCMKGGAILGTAAMVDGMIKKYEKELREKATIIVTGGIGKIIARECESEMIVDENLQLYGLKLIYDKNV